MSGFLSSDDPTPDLKEEFFIKKKLDGSFQKIVLNKPVFSLAKAPVVDTHPPKSKFGSSFKTMTLPSDLKGQVGPLLKWRDWAEQALWGEQVRMDVEPFGSASLALGAEVVLPSKTVLADHFLQYGVQWLFNLHVYEVQYLHLNMETKLRYTLYAQSAYRAAVSIHDHNDIGLLQDLLMKVSLIGGACVLHSCDNELHEYAFRGVMTLPDQFLKSL